MGAHTPGEWVADFHHEMQVGTRFTVMVHGGNRLEPIAAVPAGVVGHGREEGRANARLIAAAPDSHAANVAMVDALNVAFHIKPEWDDERIYDELPTSGVASAYFAARAAIALATGGHR